MWNARRGDNRTRDLRLLAGPTPVPATQARSTKSAAYLKPESYFEFTFYTPPPEGVLDDVYID
jgi:hypothetical protein